MKRMFQCLLVSLVLLSFLSDDIMACTTFCLKNRGEVLFGKNYDWTIGDGMVFVNKRGVSKTSSEESNPAKWVSRYGSVTFNQYGWESPSGGMNEAGLVIELMWLDETEYPTSEAVPTIDVLEWIQFNLDTASTMDEVVRNSDKVHIDSAVKLHYLVNDKRGNTAAIEFLDGKLVAHTGSEVAALANDTYAKSIAYSSGATNPATESSLDRFARASSRTKDFASRQRSDKEAVDYAFETLANVAQRNSTQWSIVYDQKRGRVYFRTRKSSGIKSIDTTALDFSCGSPVKVLDIDQKRDGDVTNQFKAYTHEANRDLIERSFDGTDFLKRVPDSARDDLARFPERFTCGTVKPPSKTTEVRKFVARQMLSDYLLSSFSLYHIYALLSS